MSIAPPPRADSAAIRSTCASGCTRESWSRVARGASTRSQPNQSWRSISASSATIRAGRSGWPGMSCARPASWRNQGGATPGTVPAVPEPPSDLVVVGAGAAGLFAALTAARTGARVTLVSARPLAETASYWAQGGLAAALAEDDSPALHLQDTITAGRGLIRRSAAEVLCDGGAGALRRPRGARRPLRRRPPRQPRARARGRPRDPPRRARRRQRDRPPDPAPALRRRRRGGADRGARGPPRPRAADATGACAGVACDDGRTIAARAVILASGGAAALWSRTTNPPGSYGSGLLLARAAGAELADLEFVQFHPTAVVGIAGREGFLVSEAVRGEGATLHDARRRALRRRAAAARRRRPRDPPAARGDRRAGGLPRHDRDRPGALPERRRRAARGRPRPGDAAHPGLPREPLRHGRDHERPGRAQHGRRPLRGRGVRLHRPARRQPARLELALGVLRVRPPRGARRASTSRPPAAPSRPRPTATSPPRRRARRARDVGDAGLERTADGLGRLLADPHPLARLVAASALAREESRGAHARADFPATDPDLDDRHSVIAAPRRAPSSSSGRERSALNINST